MGFLLLMYQIITQRLQTMPIVCRSRVQPLKWTTKAKIKDPAESRSPLKALRENPFLRHHFPLLACHSQSHQHSLKSLSDTGSCHPHRHSRTDVIMLDLHRESSHLFPSKQAGKEHQSPLQPPLTRSQELRHCLKQDSYPGYVSESCVKSNQLPVASFDLMVQHAFMSGDTGTQGSEEVGAYPISAAIGKARRSISSLPFSWPCLLKEYSSTYLM